jgi:hypothetical protein
MSRNPDFSLSVHGGLYRAHAHANTSSLELELARYCGPSVTIFTGDSALSAKLATAINAVLDQHQADLASAEAKAKSQRSAA